MSNRPLQGPAAGSYLVDGRSSKSGPATGHYFQKTVNRELLAPSENPFYRFTNSLDYRVMRADQNVDESTNPIIPAVSLEIRHGGLNLLSPSSVFLASETLTLVEAARNVDRDVQLVIEYTADGLGQAESVTLTLMCYARGHVFPLDPSLD